MTDLSQAEADRLFSLAKRRRDREIYSIPPQRGKLTVPLIDFSGREEFTLDLLRGGISLERRTYQHRARHTVVLARLDFNTPHRNPDDQEIGVPHIHRYRVGFGDKWAFPVPVEHFSFLTDPWKTLLQFMRYCNITEPPEFKTDMFS